MKKLKTIGLVTATALSLLLAGCGSDKNENKETTSISEQLDYTFIGIEPGTGAMELANNALNEYDNFKGWTISDSSTAGMLTLLDAAIAKKEPIIVLGWNPHWMFASYELKYLEDPKGVFGTESENINTIVRKDLKEDMPEAYEILDRFYWETTDMEAVMAEAQKSSFEEAAKNWIEANKDRVNEWIAGVNKVNGTELKLISLPWDSEDASANVMKQVLEQQGYKVTITPVDPAIMFQSIATGEGDASLAPWLPATHRSFYERYQKDIVDLGENLTGARTGLVVPSYMDIDSIEDLEAKK